MSNGSNGDGGRGFGGGRLGKARLRLRWGLGTAAVLVGCGQPPAPPQMPAPPVRAMTVALVPIAEEFTAVGTVVPLEVSRVAAGAEGKVVEFPFREGTLVRKDEVITKLRDKTLAIEIEGGKALMRQREAMFREMQAGFRAEEKAQAEAKMAAAKETLDLADLKLKRTDDLFRRGAARQEELEEAHSTQMRATQLFLEARADRDLKLNGYRKETIEQSQAAYEQQQQEVARLEDEMSKRTVRAPFTGYLVKKHTDLGEWVIKGAPIVTLIDLQTVEVVVKVDENRIGLVKVGGKIDVKFDAYPNQAFSGEVVHIVPQSEWAGGSRSFPVRIRLPNEFENDVPKFKEGMLARAKFRGPERQGLTVDRDAIVRGGRAPIVYVLAEIPVAGGTPKTVVRPVPIAEGLDLGPTIEVSGAAGAAKLEAGARVVNEGAERLRPEQEVRVLPNEVPRTAQQPTPPKAQ